MSAKGFTPGPWAIFKPDQQHRYPGIEAGEQSIVLYGYQGDDCGVRGESADVAQANARLIASAPTLLEALTLAASKPLAQHCTDEEWAFIRSAILTAQGEQL